MAMNIQRKTSNIANIVIYDANGNVTLPAGLTITGLNTAGFVKTNASGVLSVSSTISGSDVTGASLSTGTADTNVTITLSGTPSTALLRSATITIGWTGTLAVGRGGTGATTLTGVLIGNATASVSAITGTAGQLLRRNAGDTAYEFFTPTYLTANQTITLSGDISGSGTADISTTIGTNKVTNSMLAQVATASFLGRVTAATGNVETLTGAQAASILPDASNSARGLVNTSTQSISGAKTFANNITVNDGTVSNVIGYASINSAGAGIIGTTTAHAFAIRTNGTNAIFVHTDQNVSIGSTTNNTYKLDVNGLIRGQTGLVVNNATNSAISAKISIEAIGGAQSFKISNEGSSGFTAYHFYYGDGTSAFNLRGGTSIIQDDTWETVYISGTSTKRNFSVGSGYSFSFYDGGASRFGAIGSAKTDNNASALILRYRTGAVDIEGVRLTTTGQLKFANYTSTSAFTGTVVGYLAFDSSGNILTVTSPAAPPVQPSATFLDDLSDVTISSLTTGQYLQYSGFQWVNSNIQASDLPSAIDAAKIADGTISNTEFQYLNNVSSNIQTQIDGKVTSNAAITGATKTKVTYDAKGLVTAGADANLDDLGDVVITTPSTNQVLSYNGTNWVNATVTGSGTVTSVGLTMPTGFTVSGSPVTSTGTLAVTLSAGYDLLNNTTQTIAGAKTFSTAPVLSTITSSLLKTDASGIVSAAVLNTDYVSGNLYTSNGTLSGNRTVTMGSNTLLFDINKTAGSGVSISHTQTAANSSDTGDQTLTVNYTISGSGGTQLVSRCFGLSNSNTRTTATVSNFRVFNLTSSTSTSTITTNLDQIYIERGTANGSVTSNRAIVVATTQGTSQAVLVGQGLTGTNNTYVLLGTYSIPSGSWGIYQTQNTFNNYFNGKVLIGTVTDGGFNLDVNGTARIQGNTTISTGNLTVSSLTAGSILFAGTGGVVSQKNANLFWDNTNNRLGIGTATPSVPLDVVGNTTTINTAQFGTIGIQSYSVNNAWFGDNVFNNGGAFVRRVTGFAGLFYFAGQEGQFRFATTGNGGTSITNGSSGQGLVLFKMNLDKTVAMGDMSNVQGNYTGATFIHFGATGNIGINTTTDSGFKLDVNGTTRLQGDVTISDASSIIAGSTTGLKIGTATTQKIGFFNATPIVQPTTAVAAATFVANTGTALNDASSFDGYTIAQIVKALRNTGLLA